MSDNTQVTEQPTGLFAYIAGQPEATELTEGTVNPTPEVALVSSVNAESSENAPEAVDQQQQTGVTTQPPAIDEQTFLRIQQENKSLADERQRMADTLLALGIESGKREQALFEKSLQGLDEDEQAAERERRRIAKLEDDNKWLNGTLTAQQQQQAKVQEDMDKREFAYQVHQQLGLPNDPDIAKSLLEAGSPQELVAQAVRWQKFFSRTQAQANVARATNAQQNGVHLAAGEAAPAVAPKPVAQRSGDLIGMMRGKSYELASS